MVSKKSILINQNLIRKEKKTNLVPPPPTKIYIIYETKNY